MIADPERLTLPYTSEVARATGHLYARVARTVTPAEWELFAPYVARIEELKRERNAVVLAHHYQTVAIYRCVADIIGDSLALAQAAAATQADTIVMCGVHFMAETAKLLNPRKTVLLPDLAAGCSLAESITAEDVRALRAAHPGVPVVTYVNTSAAVKAESDVCCTSANAVAVVESLGVPKVIFIPDEYLGAWVASKTPVEIVTWRGHCEVHERFTGAEIAQLRTMHGDIVVLAHPECPSDVLAAADFVGSTTAMLGYIKERRPARVAMITECSMAGNVAEAFPEIEFTQPCVLCPHMQRITFAEDLARTGDDVAADRDRPGDRGARSALGRTDDRDRTRFAMNEQRYDAVVVGGGLAGMLTALELRPLSVALVSYRLLGELTSSAWAQGGIAAAVGDDDSPSLHAADTVRAGAGLVERRVAARLAADAPEAIERMASFGVQFDRDAASESRWAAKRRTRAGASCGRAATQRARSWFARWPRPCASRQRSSPTKARGLWT